MSARGHPPGWRAIWLELRPQVRPYHGWIGLAGFVMTMLATLITAAAMVASLWLNPQVLTGRWHEPLLVIVLLVAADAFWFFVWRIYRRIAAENLAGRG